MSGLKINHENEMTSGVAEVFKKMNPNISISNHYVALETAWRVALRPSTVSRPAQLPSSPLESWVSGSVCCSAALWKDLVHVWNLRIIADE